MGAAAGNFPDTLCDRPAASFFPLAMPTKLRANIVENLKEQFWEGRLK